MLTSVLSVAALTSTSIMAATAQWNTKSQKILMSNNFGECIISPTVPPTDFGLDCPPVWVSLSCTGDFNSKGLAQNKLGVAQLAEITGNEVSIKVDDSKKHNGVCFVDSIQSVTPTP